VHRTRVLRGPRRPDGAFASTELVTPYGRSTASGPIQKGRD
jgi:hypothetical protein